MFILPPEAQTKNQKLECSLRWMALLRADKMKHNRLLHWAWDEQYMSLYRHIQFLNNLAQADCEDLRFDRNPAVDRITGKPRRQKAPWFLDEMKTEDDFIDAYFINNLLVYPPQELLKHLPVGHPDNTDNTSPNFGSVYAFTLGLGGALTRRGIKALDNESIVYELTLARDNTKRSDFWDGRINVTG